MILPGFLFNADEVIDPAPGNAKLDEALELCRGTLAFTSRQTAPQDWATTQNNLGIALMILANGRAANKVRSIRSSRWLLIGRPWKLYTREQLPQDWAMTQNNLGIALRDLGERASGEQGAQYLEQSVAAYRAALEVYTREQLPQDWATTQNNLGIALMESGERASGEKVRSI